MEMTQTSIFATSRSLIWKTLTLETEKQKGICTNSENNFCFYPFLFFVFISIWHLFLWKVNFVWNEKSDLIFCSNTILEHFIDLCQRNVNMNWSSFYFVCIYYIIMVFLLCRLPYLEMFCSDWKIKNKTNTTEFRDGVINLNNKFNSVNQYNVKTLLQVFHVNYIHKYYRDNTKRSIKFCMFCFYIYYNEIVK